MPDLGIALDQYNYLMGLAGLVSAMVVMIIWSRGL